MTGLPCSVMLLHMADIRIDGPGLRVIRERSDMSIADVVTAIRENGIDVHPDHLRNIELGHRQASPKLIGAIAKALKISKIELIAADESVAS